MVCEVPALPPQAWEARTRLLHVCAQAGSWPLPVVRTWAVVVARRRVRRYAARSSRSMVAVCCCSGRGHRCRRSSGAAMGSNNCGWGRLDATVSGYSWCCLSAMLVAGVVVECPIHLQIHNGATVSDSPCPSCPCLSQLQRATAIINVRKREEAAPRSLRMLQELNGRVVVWCRRRNEGN